MSGPRQRGFTKMELVVVIVVLGILAAVALPKMMDRDNRDRIDALNGMTVNIRSAANMAHGVWLANGNTETITVDGTSVNIVNGYPDAYGIFNLIQDKTGFTVAVTGKTTSFSPEGARSAAACTVMYEQAENADSPFMLRVKPPASLQSGC